MTTTMTTVPNDDSDRLNAAEKAWLEFTNGTYSETDKRIFVAGFYKGESYRARLERQRKQAQRRYEADYERRYGSEKECL